MGSLFGGGTQTTKQTVDNTPWAAQQPFLTQGFQNASDIYDQRQAAGPYTGNFVAGPNDFQTNAENGAGLYGSTMGASLPYTVGSASSNLVGANTPFLGNAESLAANGIGGPNAALMRTLQNYGTGASTTQGPSSGLSSALNQSAINGANAMGTFQNGLNNAASTAASDPTSRITADAAQYANNPGVQAAINSTNAGIDQTLNEQTVPGLNRQAAMGGALNSSRAGMAEGMANEGAGIAKGTADASILNNAYNTGTNTSANLYANGLNSSVNANLGGYNASAAAAEGVGNQQQGLSEFNTNSQLGAAGTGLSTGLNYALGNANTQLGANAQLGTGVGLGMNGASTAGNLAAGDFGLQAGAGALQQAGQQGALTNAIDQWQMQNQYPQSVLNDYWNIVGKPLGNTQSGTTTQQNSGPGIAGGILGLGLGAAGLFGSGGAFPGALGGLFGGGSGVVDNGAFLT